jgi:hypothetical protein
MLLPPFHLLVLKIGLDLGGVPWNAIENVCSSPSPPFYRLHNGTCANLTEQRLLQKVALMQLAPSPSPLVPHKTRERPEATPIQTCSYLKVTHDARMVADDWSPPYALPWVIRKSFTTITINRPSTPRHPTGQHAVTLTLTGQCKCRTVDHNWRPRYSWPCAKYDVEDYQE